MNDWTLATSNGFYAIRGNTLEDEVITGKPLIVDPSITFRKHFEIPGTVDKSPEKLKIELFSRFLPSEIDNYICQFRDGPVSNDGTRRVLGLAIKEKDMQWLEGLHGEDPQKFLFETLLAPREGSNTPSAAEINLPDGVFFGVFENEFLTWARYLGDPGEKTLDQTRDYIHDEFDTIDSIQQSPPFTGIEEASDWVKGIKQWLPETPDPDHAISRDRNQNYWETWRSTAWTLLFLAFVTLGVWTVYYRHSIKQKQSWLKDNSKQLLNTTNNPNRKLQSKIKSIQQKLQTQADEILDVHPRLYQLDQAIMANDLYLLQLKIRKNQSQLVVMTDSLQSAEEMKETLLAVPNIDRVEIVSTNPQQDSEFQYKVNLNVKWTANS